MSIISINTNLIVEGFSPRQNFSGKEELKRSIEKEGLIEPLLVYKGQEIYIIIDGNMRFSAVKELGWKNVECIITDADEEKSYRLSYIKNTQRENFNPIEEALHLQAVRDKFGYNVEDLVRQGYGTHRSTLDDKLRLLTLPEDIQKDIIKGKLDTSKGYELAKVKDEKSQRDLYNKAVEKDLSVRELKKEVLSLNVRRKRQREKELPRVEIPAGDIPGVFIKDASDMSELEDNSVGLVVTSPPYWVEKDYEKGVSFQDHLAILDKVFKECVRVLTPGGKVCVNVGDILTYGSRVNGKPEIELIGHHILEIMQNHGMRLRDRIIWNKGYTWVNNPQVSYHQGIQHTSYRVLNNFEYVYIFQKDGKRKVPFDLEHDSKISKDEWKTLINGVWDIPPVRSQEDHPAQFPEELPRRLIKLYSYKGDIVLDCFGGTMTTVKVANELGRNGIGYEKDEKYKSAIMKKLGIKKEDMKKPELVQEPKDNETEYAVQLQEVIEDIVSTDQGQAKRIMALHAPIREHLSKEDITIEWKTEGDDPDHIGSPSLPQIYKPDDYDGATSNSFQLGKTGTSD